MGRSGYGDDDWDGEGPPPEFWRQAVAQAVKGRRGKRFLTDLRDALDAVPVKRLIASELVDSDGEVCAIGSVGVRRGVDMSEFKRPPDCSEEDWESDWECEAYERAQSLGSMFDIAPCLAQEVMYYNDEMSHDSETPEHRWTRMRRWVAKKLGEDWMPPPTPVSASG